ncbi:Blue (Type 1) copper domain containing protein [Rhodotorula toruloides]|uniref:BY PROTMAP: gi/472586203/gb/EMS23731.1/ Blue (Type 1) copper domain containing protein [Rhodosporidium toruloides NP11] gi/647397711/emb/CDR40947.1/ RHTO0S05e09472g1_1 [Rhodosporidium toruloides] n=1 Tax=Rhodotorula toruloides TaxID=5286 RepID=A0A0K3CSR0_RHOTO|nr:Blue (Type 1) copper domain containing protein [Rhodotorula toruloides]
MKTSTSLILSLGLACLPLGLAHANSPSSHLKRNLKRSPQNYGSGGAYGGAMGGMGAMSEMGGMGGGAMSEQASASDSMSMGMDMSASLGMSGMSEMATPTESAMGAAESAMATIQGAMGSMGPSLDMCVQRCMASNGLSWPSGVASAALPALTGTPSMMAPMPSGAGTMVNGSLVGGPGQVVVAPKKGDLRFVPFNIVASPGQTVEFIWGAGPHTVTQSSQLSICNATQQTGAFNSGMQQAGFQMPLTVNDSSTIFYYCAVPNHCQKGMFGLINGQVSLDGKNTFGESQENQDLLDITIQITSGNSAAASWGESLSTAQFESWALPWAMQQIMYTRQYFAENPQLLAATAGNATSPSTSTISNAGSPASTGSAASASASASMSSGAASSNKAAGALALIAIVALALLA